MMRDAEKTIGNLIDKQRVSYIASISEDGFPNVYLWFLLHYEYFLHAGRPVSEEPKRQYLFLW